MENIKEYVDFCSTFGDPIIYNNIKIYPVLAKDYYNFLGIVDILKIEKNKSANIEIIQMSYLYYLVRLMLYDEGVKDAFLTLLNLSLHMELEQDKVNKGFAENDILLQKLPNGVDYYINGWDVVMHLHTKSAEIEIGGHSFNSSQFDDVRKIILYQNLSDYDDIEMSADFERVLEDFYRLKNKGIHHPSLEEKRMAVTTNSPYSLESLDALPIRTFDKMFESLLMKIVEEL